MSAGFLSSLPPFGLNESPSQKEGKFLAGGGGMMGA